ncbi:hypothetical protein FEM41_20220 [Jejubacter calystegiae]|uniref:Prophage protein n=1 Tax=Jejubacter calystegiae TaxID=2579935 RepID=A0A4P8YNK4_9ENTR|nr:hypothetical protein [Jejubacter calystegiae]QCT21813.1 hypothetical protein FEM41_20220 [Jejubacter calystegiae]
MSTIIELHVERNEEGYWTHPDYSALFGDREVISQEEFQAWERKHGLESTITLLENDGDDEIRKRYFEDGETDISEWSPSKPNGEGWFIASIHDTEEGPVCVWLREARSNGE